MTRIEQALAWCRRHEGCAYPPRHFRVLNKAGLIYYHYEDDCWPLVSDTPLFKLAKAAVAAEPGSMAALAEFIAQLSDEGGPE